MQTATFVSKGSNRYSLQIKPEGKSFKGEEVVTWRAEMVSFEGGVFKTDDQEMADAIRNTDAFKKGRVFELKVGEEEPVAQKSKTVRGAISSGTLKEEAGVRAESEKLSFKEKKVTKCDVPGCGKTFENDFYGRKLRMHKLQHRRWGDKKK